MACNRGHEEWTFHMLNDRTGDNEIIIFCLKVERGVVTGTVSDENGAPLSTDTRVKGIRVHVPEQLGLRVPTGEPVTHLMTLRLRWDKSTENIKVLTLGSVFEDDSNLVKFEGRFLAYPALLGFAEASRILLPGPDTGDTGTGSGTQT
jgi:hypothetical protein